MTQREKAIEEIKVSGENIMKVLLGEISRMDWVKPSASDKVTTIFMRHKVLITGF